MKSNVLAEKQRRTSVIPQLPIRSFDFEILGDEDLATEALIQGFVVAGEGFDFAIAGFTGRSCVHGAFRTHAFA